MIDFQADTVFNLGPADAVDAAKLLEPMLIDDEHVFAAFKSVRDQVIFTNRRLIAINVKGVTGKSKDFTSLPYSKIQAFSVETAGLLDFDSEMILWFAGLGQVTFQFKSRFDIKGFNKVIGKYVL
jgi:hypothetical protein